MKPNMSVFVALLFVEFFFISFCSGTSYIGCLESEREALLKLKQDLRDPSNRLASWIGDGDCCKWAGVVCNNFTGHVLQLNLANPFNDSITYAEYERSRLVGKINPSLLGLKHLTHLDLSDNNFQGNQIPKSLGSLENLRYLNLSAAGFAGKIPHQLGNLSNLLYLDLSGHYWELHADSISWLSGLSLLEHLDMNRVNLSKASDSLIVIHSLSSLKVLKLSSCELSLFPPLSSANLSSLNTFDVSENEFQDKIPNGIENLTSLRHLDLSDNQFNSTMPDWLSKLNDLEYLSLMGNSLQGTISSIGLENLTNSMKTLDLSFNDELGGKIPSSFARLCKLTSIDIRYVKLSQDLSEILDIFSACVAYQLESLLAESCQIFGQFTNQLGQFKTLQSLSLENNSVSGQLPAALGELSSLTYLVLSNNKLSGFIPLSLGQISHLKFLDLSNNRLNGTVSEIHFVNLTKLSFFSANGNSLIFKVNPNWVPPFQLEELFLGSCYLGPQFPSWLQSQRELVNLDISNTGISDTIPYWFYQIDDWDLSSNQISGEIPNFDSLTMPLIKLSYTRGAFLDLSNNAFSGSIFHFICQRKSKNFGYLKLSKNLFSGNIPDCWMNWPLLLVLDLGHNNFTGSLPMSIGTLWSLRSLNLRSNSLSGIIPMAFQNCSDLKVLDLGENELIGNIPTWMGERFSNLLILNLRSNKFQGVFPIQFCRLNFLQILDIAYNNLSGTIPRCINNFTAMATTDSDYSRNYLYFGFVGINYVMEEASLVIKGSMAEYNRTLNLVRSIDISKNKFSGEIPTEVTNLRELQSLNFSHNSFIGDIPENIGNMSSIESLDFSSNQLSGKIPQSISSLSFMNHLNLYDNNLIGKIPSSTQLQSFDASCFADNYLCGAPLPNCSEKNAFVPGDESGNGNEDEDEVDWLLYVSMALGFVVGFWGFIGPLLINRRWRYTYCHFLDRLGDKFCYFVRKCY